MYRSDKYFARQIEFVDIAVTAERSVQFVTDFFHLVHATDSDLEKREKNLGKVTKT